MNTCHICGVKFKEFSMIKCKLCCDGLEQDACEYCAKVYNAYRAHKAGARNAYFAELQALRAECIRNERKNNGHAAEK